jgi:DNA repair protein RadD
MGVTLRPHQLIACEDIDLRFNEGYKNVLCILPTGAGKTLVKAEYARRDHAKGLVTVILAHRDVLVCQISDALCMMGVEHGFICADKTRKLATNNNHVKYGDSFYSEYSNTIVISVDTFNARLKAGTVPVDFCSRVYRWMIDESHHLTKDSKWGRCVESFPNAFGLGFTATPIRGDKKGLGDHADGYYHFLSDTTCMLDLIKAGMLTPYKIHAPDTIDITGVRRDANGELNNKQLYIKTKEADITGNAVKQYVKLLSGQPVITFCVNIAHAEEVAAEFNAAGIPSRAVSSKSSDKEREEAVADLRAGRIMNLTNCDLFGEGFDAPSVAGVVMLRGTTSYSLYKQQFGRMLRPSEGKVYGILLDHVGNTKYFMQEYGLMSPHDDPKWTLDRVDRSKKRNDDDEDNKLVETNTCTECGCFGVVKPDDYIDDGSHALVFINGLCPECGHVETADEKDTRVRELKIKEGELIELSFDVIDSIIQERNSFLKPVAEFAASVGNSSFKMAAVNNFANRQHALNVLRHWIQQWCIMHGGDTGQSKALVQLDFEVTFGINIFKAQSTTGPKMNELTSRVQSNIQQRRKTA